MSGSSDHSEERPAPSPPSSHSRLGFKSLLVRGCLLFAVGVGFAFVLNLLQIQRNVTHFSSDLIDNLFKSAWWVPPSCGTAAAVIGLLHPMFDQILGESHKEEQEWANVMKIIAVFIGINYASAVYSSPAVSLLGVEILLQEDNITHLKDAKIEYSNNLQLSLTLAAMSIGLWWLFDRSRSGFGLGVSIAVLATLVTQLLVYYGVYMYTEPDFLYVRSWLPCVFFSGGVTMGNIGRQLAMYDYRNKEHHD